MAATVNIRPTLFTASLAGLIAAVAWSFSWARWGGPGADGGTELVVATLLVVVLPAHALVIGFGRQPSAATPGLDLPLLKRIGVWLATAAGVTALRAVTGL